MARFGVKGFPTLKYFRDGEMRYDYGHGRTTEDLLEFMVEPKEPPPPEPDWTEVESEVRQWVWLSRSYYSRQKLQSS